MIPTCKYIIAIDRKQAAKYLKMKLYPASELAKYSTTGICHKYIQILFDDTKTINPFNNPFIFCVSDLTNKLKLKIIIKA